MARSGSVSFLLLPLLLTSVVANVYQQLPDVTNAERFSHTNVATSSECARECDDSQICSGYVYADGTCELYVGGCFEPAYSNQYWGKVSANFMAKDACPGDACECPSGFARHGTRCYALLDQLVNDWSDALDNCHGQSTYANLAVFRSKADQKQINAAAAGARTNVWLQMNWRDTLSYGDFCDSDASTEYFWATGQPIEKGEVTYLPPSLAGNTGWYTVNWQYNPTPYHPLCQLAYCYKPDCPL